MKPTPADLRIDREGRWFANGLPVIHEKILKLFQTSLVRDGNAYFVRIGDQENVVFVEDAPFYVKNVYAENNADGLDVVRLVLNDGRTIDLQPESLRATDMQSIYCSIPGTNLEAGFSKDALSQLGRFLEHDPENDIYFIDLNGSRFDILHESA